MNEAVMNANYSTVSGANSPGRWTPPTRSAQENSPFAGEISAARIVVADDEPLTAWSLAERLRADGHVVVEAGSTQAALAAVAEGADVVLAADTLPDARDGDVLRRINEIDSDVPSILLTARTSVETALDAMRDGAFQIAHKPFDLDDIVFLVSRALETSVLRREVRRAHDSLGCAYRVQAIVGPSGAMVMLRSLVTGVAMSPASTVLLMGEIGTGKDLVAKVLHYSGLRANRPYLRVACSSLPETLLEDELFGHERGTSTDRRQLRRGLFEAADSGTVFVDEIDEMAPPLQAKLLRLLERRSFRRVGGSHDITANACVIAATSRNLDGEVRAGRFRQDLFFRMNVLPILLPPLRQHAEDIPALVDSFIGVFNREFRKDVKGVSPEALRALQAYTWPGNVRELRNSVERAMLLVRGEYLQASDFPAVSRAEATPVARDDFHLPADGVNLDALEQSLVRQALARCGGNQTRAAGLLAMNRDQIRYRVEKYRFPRLRQT
jgi:DNA-binding NtrC family response regulator